MLDYSGSGRQYCDTHPFLSYSPDFRCLISLLVAEYSRQMDALHFISFLHSVSLPGLCLVAGGCYTGGAV